MAGTWRWSATASTTFPRSRPPASAIAQGSGSEMARSVADVVLVNGDFAAVPEMVARAAKDPAQPAAGHEAVRGQVGVRGLPRFSRSGSRTSPTRLLPRHLTLAATLTVGVPAFFLALAPSSGPWRTEGFLREVGRFAVPAGTFAGIGVLFAYLFTVNVAGCRRGGADGGDHGADRGRLYLVVALEAAPGTAATWVSIPRRRATSSPTCSSSPSAACATSSAWRRSAAGASSARSAESPSRSAACF